MKRILYLLLILAFLPAGSSYSKEQVVLDLWELSAAEKLIAGLIRDFEEENPGIKVRFQQLTWEYGTDKLLTSMAAGNPPDVFELGTTWLPKFAGAGELLDITGRIEDIKEKEVESEPALLNQILLWLLSQLTLATKYFTISGSN